MTKTELKAALDLAGVSYKAKATLEQLQAAYDALTPATPDAAPPAPADDFTMSDEELAGQTLRTPAQAQEEEAPAPAPAPEPTPTPEPTGNGLKIEKDRPEQNGIKRPSIGGKCRAIWDALDEYRAETGELPTSKTVKELAADSGWNPNNASIEFYQWRKYHGIGKQA